MTVGEGFATTSTAPYSDGMDVLDQSRVWTTLTALVIGVGFVAVLYVAALSSASGVSLNHPGCSDVERAVELTIERGLVGYTGG